MGLELECVDLSGNQPMCSEKELAKFVGTHPLLTKLKIHDWKLDSAFQRLFTLQTITHFGTIRNYLY